MPGCDLPTGEPTTLEIRLRETDEQSAAMSGELEVGRHNLELPNRLPTSSEMRAARSWKLHEAVESPFLVVARLMYPDLLSAASHEEEAWQRFAKGVAADLRSLPGAGRLLYISFRSAEFEEVDQLRTFLDLQHILGFNPVTVQYGTSPSIEDFLSAFRVARSWARDRGVEHLMPVFPPLENRDKARDLMKTLLDTGAASMGIDLRGRFPYQTLRAVEDIKRKRPEVWMHAFQVPPKVRLGSRFLHASQGMVLPYYGVDSFSRWIVPPPPYPVKKERVNFFDPKGWGILKEAEHREAYGNVVNCRCPTCRGKAFDDFMKPDDRGFLNLAKVHDHFSQGSELHSAGQRLKEEGYRAMLEERRFTKDLLQRVG